MFKKIVTVVEVLVLLMAAGFVIALFAGGSGSSGSTASSGGSSSSGEQLYVASCAACHGSQGQGGIGPALGDGAAVEAFPDPAAQIAVVTRGRGAMPAFGGRMSPEQIAAVVEYTRTGLGQ
jgi:mono/diheme cytochrome c family protein